MLEGLSRGVVRQSIQEVSSRALSSNLRNIFLCILAQSVNGLLKAPFSGVCLRSLCRITGGRGVRGKSDRVSVFQYGCVS